MSTAHGRLTVHQIRVVGFGPAKAGSESSSRPLHSQPGMHRVQTTQCVVFRTVVSHHYNCSKPCSTTSLSSHFISIWAVNRAAKFLPRLLKFDSVSRWTRIWPLYVRCISTLRTWFFFLFVFYSSIWMFWQRNGWRCSCQRHGLWESPNRVVRRIKLKKIK